MDTVEHKAIQHSDELPAWSAGARPAAPSFGWRGTLLATAIMVAFGLWLGDQPAPVAAVAKVAAVPPAAVAPAAAPPLVLAAPMPAVPVKAVLAPVVVARKKPAAPVKSRAGDRHHWVAVVSGPGRGMHCKHGELARECLARYR